MAQPLPFAQGFYVSESLPISGQECVNLYPNIPQTNTVTQQSLLTTPGLRSMETTAGDDEFNRGGHVFNAIPYEVNGNNLYRIDRTFDAFGAPVFNAVQVNGIVPLPGDQLVSMADNGTAGGEMCIVLPEGDNKFNAYIFDDQAETLTQIDDTDFDGPVSSVVYIDGFFMFTKKDGNKFFISNLRQGLVYTATDFADAEVDPDPIKTAFILRNQPYIFGSETVEPFQNIGGSGFPFLRVEGGVIDKGIDAPNSIVEIDGNMAWIGSAVKEQAAIWLSDGGKPQKISTTAIDNQIRTYTDSEIENAFVVTYSQSGALFAAWTFPGRETFVYEAISGLWHTRESFRSDSAVPWRVASIVEAYGELIVGDLLTNQYGIIDRDVFTEFGTEIRRRVVLPPIRNGGTAFFMNSLEVVGESGVGLTDGQGSNPQMLMSYSDNGGRTFNNPIARSFGKIGEFTFRTIWNQLGRVSQQRSIRLDMSDPVKWVIYIIEVDID